MGNLGTILRSSVAFGAEAIVLYGESVDIYNPKCVRASVGNLWKIPVYHIKDFKFDVKNNAQIAASGIIWAYKDHLQNDKFMYNKQVFSSEEALSTLIQGRGFYAVAWNKLYRKT